MPTADKARLLFFLGPHFGVLFLNKIKHFKGLNYKVVTYSEESDSYYGYESVIDYCKKNHVDFLDTSVSGSDVSNFCTSFKPDAILCGYYAKILPAGILGPVKGAAYNIHPGKLPCYRGPFPTAWALIQGEREIGITIHQLDTKIDSGPIIAQETFAILPEETGYTLYKRSMDLSADFLFSSMPDLLKRNYTLIDQATLGMGSYYGRIEPHYHIDWKDHVERIRTKVRVHAKPYFPAHSFIKNKMILINRCKTASFQGAKLQVPGIILDVAHDHAFYVSGSDGILEITDYDVCPLNGEKKEEFIKKGLRLF